MPNPTESFTDRVVGVWLMPYQGANLVADARAWVAAAVPDETSEVSRSVYTITGRRAKVSQRGTVHLAEGTINGEVMAGFDLDAKAWLDRLEDLVFRQHLYVVRLVSNRDDFPVELGSYSKSPTHLGSGSAWMIDLEFREVT